MHLQRSSYDVVVVGARAAGAATAMLLGRRGVDTLVVDRSAYGADTLSTHALMRAGVLQLARWGLLDEVIDAGTPPVRRSTFTYAHDRVVVQIKPAEGVDALYAPRRTVLDPILVDAATRAGAEVRHGATVSEVVRDRTGRVSGVVVRDVAGRTSEVAARIVVGADGVRSRIAGAVGAPVERRGTGATAFSYGYWSDLPDEGYEWVFRPGAVAGVIPTNGGQSCVFAGSAHEGPGRGGLDVLRDVLAEASPELAERVERAVAPAGVRSFGGHPGFMRRAWGPGWALVGDAGYWKDPIGAHGLTDALRDAELLARALVPALDDPGDEAELLAGYQAVRDRLSIELFDVVDEIAGLGWDEREIGALLLRLSGSMADEVEALAALDEPARAIT